MSEGLFSPTPCCLHRLVQILLRCSKHLSESQSSSPGPTPFWSPLTIAADTRPDVWTGDGPKPSEAHSVYLQGFGSGTLRATVRKSLALSNQHSCLPLASLGPSEEGMSAGLTDRPSSQVHSISCSTHSLICSGSIPCWMTAGTLQYFI